MVFYGLKRWEQQDKNIKGGTIGDIVEEFLSMSDKPKHISEITAYAESGAGLLACVR